MNLDPQNPAQGIMLDQEFDNAKFYTVSCSCGNPNDQIKLEIEVEDGVITTHVWTKVKTDRWRQTWPIMDRDYGSWLYYIKYLINAVTSRIRVIWSVLTRGYVEMESWTILNEQQSVNFAWALHNAVKELQAHRQTQEVLTKTKK
ncbi:MAG: hypothetical protein N2235_05210 [Fischerella sp.]|nr:hypothetical protein [Fischerella sp.]